MTPLPDDLMAFLREQRDVREYRRALAVKLAWQGYTCEAIADRLDVSPGFVSQAKKAYETQGVRGLMLKYQGFKPYLSQEQRQSIIAWLKAQQEWSVERLQEHIQELYGVVFQSRQSYYQLLAEAELSHKKAQSTHPQHDDVRVAVKKKEISDLMQANEAGILDGSVVVLFVDECHLVWHDACGYVWGPRNQRIKLPIANQRERQTYYGAIDAMTGELTVIPCDGADGRWTIIFVEFLRQRFEGKRLIICWDGASYHRGEEMQDYLEGVNMGKLRHEWAITCVQFAPYAPEQNPIENVWLQAKEFIRKNWYQCTLFQHVTTLFEQALDTIAFHFDRLRMYTQDLQLI